MGNTKTNELIAEYNLYMGWRTDKYEDAEWRSTLLSAVEADLAESGVILEQDFRTGQWEMPIPYEVVLAALIKADADASSLFTTGRQARAIKFFQEHVRPGIDWMRAHNRALPDLLSWEIAGAAYAYLRERR